MELEGKGRQAAGGLARRDAADLLDPGRRRQRWKTNTADGGAKKNAHVRVCQARGALGDQHEHENQIHALTVSRDQPEGGRPQRAPSANRRTTCQHLRGRPEKWQRE